MQTELCLALREDVMSEDRASFLSLAAKVPNIIYRIRLKEENRIEFFNNMLEPMTGCPAEELTHGEVCSIGPLILAEDRARVLKSVKQAVAMNKSFEVEYRLRHRDGTLRQFLERGSPVYGRDGSPKYLDGVILDITLHKSAEEALRISEENFQQLAENIREVFWIGSPDWNKVIYVSPGYEDVWGRSCESLRQYPRSWLDAVVEEDREKVLQDLKRMVTGDLSEPEFPEYRIVRPDGSVRWILARAFPVQNKQGKTYRIAGFAEDITERKKAVQALRKTRDELQFRVHEGTAKLAVANADLKRRAEQLQSVSAELILAEHRERSRLALLIHDNLQQYLVAAQMGLELLSDEAAQDQQEQVANIMGLIDKSIEVSRSLAVELSPPVLHTHGLGSALEWLAEWVKKNYQLTVELQINAQIQIQDEHVRVLLFQSLRELLFNVVKHSGVKSALLRVMRDETDHLRIAVSDQGVGFDPSASRKGLAQAGGFGLAAVRDRLTILGGDLEVKSAPGAGTTITLVAPLKE